MNRRPLARQIATIANALMVVSLFLAMVWLNASLVLFSSCWVLYGIAWWMGGTGPMEEGGSQRGRPTVVPSAAAR